MDILTENQKHNAALVGLATVPHKHSANKDMA